MITSLNVSEHFELQKKIIERTVEINNFISEVETNSDWREFQWCNAIPEVLEPIITEDYVIVSYESMDGYIDSWSVPTFLFDYDDEQLTNYALEQAKTYDEGQKAIKENELKQLAERLGYNLVKE